MQLSRILFCAGRLAILGLAAVILPRAMAAPAAQDTRPMARQLAKDYEPAILTVRVVMSIGRGGNSFETKNECNATVLQPDGLAVVSLTEIDPAGIYKQINGGAADDDSVESRVKDIKYVMPDKKEVPATIVLRDRDLKLAMLRPLKKPDQPMKYIDLKNAVQLDLVDPYIILSRLGPIADRRISIESGVIESVVTKPRRFYVPSSEGNSAMAVPAFSAEGKLAGLAALRTQSGDGSDNEGIMNDRSQRTLRIILPASDVAEIAAQAPQEGEKLGGADKDAKKPAAGAAAKPAEGKPAGKKE